MSGVAEKLPWMQAVTEGAVAETAGFYLWLFSLYQKKKKTCFVDTLRK